MVVTDVPIQELMHLTRERDKATTFQSAYLVLFWLKPYASKLYLRGSNRIVAETPDVILGLAAWHKKS